MTFRANVCLDPLPIDEIGDVVRDGVDTSQDVNVKVKVKFSPEQATKAQRGSRGIALLFLDLGT